MNLTVIPLCMYMYVRALLCSVDHACVCLPLKEREKEWAITLSSAEKSSLIHSRIDGNVDR